MIGFFFPRPLKKSVLNPADPNLYTRHQKLASPLHFLIPYHLPMYRFWEFKGTAAPDFGVFLTCMDRSGIAKEPLLVFQFFPLLGTLIFVCHLKFLKLNKTSRRVVLGRFSISFYSRNCWYLLFFILNFKVKFKLRGFK